VMTDADNLLAERFAAIREEDDDGDWDDVLRRIPESPRARGRTVLVVAIAVIAVVAPAFALSASVRELVGLGGQPEPVYARAQLVVSAPISGRRVARVWVSPSNVDGVCEFVTIDPAGAAGRPVRMTGGGACTRQIDGRLDWTVAQGRNETILHGRFGGREPVAGVELRWYGGSQRLVYGRHGFFIAETPALANPPFRRLPFEVVVTGKDDGVLARSRIPTSLLYHDWKKVLPRLHRYRVAHGCDTTHIWRCRTR
jgi:hypothetical protein